MPNSELRTTARRLFDIGIRAADPALAVQKALTRRPLPALSQGRHIFIAFGKAACAMTEAALRHLPTGQECTAIAVTNYENQRAIDGCIVLGAGHPTPDQSGLEAGKLVMNQLIQASKADHVLFLVSGGGSALLPAPLPGISLADKIKVNDLLLANGFDIHETNMVRQQLSLLKGGGMSRLADPATQRSLIVSDVIGDDPQVIASGPTVGAIGTPTSAAELLQDKGIWDKLPESVTTALSQGGHEKTEDPEAKDVQVICSNRHSIEAIYKSVPDWHPQIVSSRLSGNVVDASRALISFAAEKPLGGKQLLIWGGETTVNVTGTGKGGRNQELALRFALEAEKIPGDWVFLAGGTDGRDGPTDAAGGLVDRTTIDRAFASGADVAALLGNSDSYQALGAANDLLITGATGTNVADIALFLRR